LLIAIVPLWAAQDDYAQARQKLLQEIAQLTQDTAPVTGKRSLDPRVMAAMEKVPRHSFVPEDQKKHAYRNRPLPIGHGQTISQPYVVAIMTELMAVKPNDVVLEIGTGSGYQAAILAELAREVYTIEIIEPLGKQAQETLTASGYRNVQVKIGDGYYGWPEHGPFDAIVVTAAASHVPLPLVKQLKPLGKMVIPIGAPFMTQQLMLVEKAEDGSITSRLILPVQFVPLTGQH
jgi:protein-L-isoaspartate(D-aspartate) O-methyltransferase